MRWASVLVLLALAVRGATVAVSRYRGRQGAAPVGEQAPVGPGRAYLGLGAVTMMNPLTVIYFTALVLGGQTASAPGRPEQAAFVLAAFAASASW